MVSAIFYPGRALIALKVPLSKGIGQKHRRGQTNWGVTRLAQTHSVDRFPGQLTAAEKAEFLASWLQSESTGSDRWVFSLVGPRICLVEVPKKATMNLVCPGPLCK